jgi:peptidoglycan LD-endopeptidase CwlK
MTTAHRDLDALHPPFRSKVEAVITDLGHYAERHMPGYRWVVAEGYRSVARQQWLYAQGRTRPGRIATHRDGVNSRSNHQSSIAVDFAPSKRNEKGRWVLDYSIDDAHWNYLGHLARKHGLVWGGDWKTFVDRPHVEWPESDKPAYAAARKWQKERGL